MPSVVNKTEVPVWVAPPSTAKCVDATPERLSEGTSPSVTVELFHSGNVAADVVGACVSIFTDVLTEFVTLPATSEIVAEAETAEPSELRRAFDGQLPAMPDSASEQIQ